ncbi:MAG: Flp pilus assembly complex ATPase component TadA [Myxococcales bacterium]|nr:Flp pilus assembly complex ATPase component TadA [Myxococcales bacterium]
MQAPVLSDAAGQALGGAFGKAYGYVIQQRVALPPSWAPGDVEDATLRKRLEGPVRDALRGVSLPGGTDARAAGDALLAELIGGGPLEGLLADASVERIYSNGARGITAIRGGAASDAGRFSSPAAAHLVATRLLAAVGIEASGGAAEGYLADGSRVHVAFNAAGGPAITLDRPRAAADLGALVGGGVLSNEMATFLAQAVASGRNIVIASNDVDIRFDLIGALLGHAASTLRVVAVEGGGRLPSGSGRHVQLAAAPGIAHADLVRQAVKMRPDRLVLADARGEDTYVALTALSGAVNGGILGLDAESTDDALIRLVRQASLGVRADDGPLEGLVRETVDVLVQLLRYADGRVSVTQIVDVDGEVQDVFTGLGGFRATGHVPRWVSNAQSLGHAVDLSIFS